MLEPNIKNLLEAVLLAAGKPLSEDHLLKIFTEEERPSMEVVREALEQLMAESQKRGVELVKVASGYRFQIKKEWAPWITRLWEEKPQKYTRALLETMALIAYRQPITRGEIEDIRGVAVSTSIIRTVEERGWVRVVGHKEVPGRPALYATTKEFLNYFNLASLKELPLLPDIMDLDAVELESEFPEIEPSHTMLIEETEQELELAVAENE